MSQIDHGSASSRPPRLRRPAAGAGAVVIGVLVLALLVAVLFAANSNEVIGWIVVVVAGLWLVLAAIVFATLHRGARAVGQRWDSTNASLAARNQDKTVHVIDEDERNHELKLDHSFKIIQVQHGVVMKNRGLGTPEADEQVSRALETIQITANNARDMITERRRSRTSTSVDGEIID